MAHETGLTKSMAAIQGEPLRVTNGLTILIYDTINGQLGSLGYKPTYRGFNSIHKW